MLRVGASKRTLIAADSVIGSEASRGVLRSPKKGWVAAQRKAGPDTRLLSMPSRFSTIGFPLLDESEFSDLATHMAAEAQRIPVSGGTYLLWASPGGEQVWLQGDSDGYLVGLTPHFAGKSQVSVYVRSILRPGRDIARRHDPGVGERRDRADGRDPRLPDRDRCAQPRHPRPLRTPDLCSVQVAAFAFEASTFPSEDTYYASREPGGFASRSYVPSGTFTPDGGATEPPQAFGIFTGHVLEATVKRNRWTDAAFYWALVDTRGGNIRRCD